MIFNLYCVIIQLTVTVIKINVNSIPQIASVMAIGSSFNFYSL